MDFATSILPGWHTTIFPPYFVAGAVFSGFGMVLTAAHHRAQRDELERYITLDHLDRMAKITLFTGSIVAFAYATEFFTAWYSGNPDERFAFVNRATGPVRVGLLDDGHVQRRGSAVPLVAPRAREPSPLLAICVLINVGMWFERFVIIVTSLHRSYLPSSWVMYRRRRLRSARWSEASGCFFPVFSFHPVPSDDRDLGDQGAGRARPSTPLGAGPFGGA